MASLIPPELMARLLATQNRVQTVPTGQEQETDFGSLNPAQQLRAAHASLVARRGGQGQSSSPPSNFSYSRSGSSPTAAAIGKQILTRTYLGDRDLPDDLQQLRDDPATDLQTYERLLKTWTTANPKQHNFSGKEEAAPQPTIGGPTPPGVLPGTMQIKAGSGRDGRTPMSGQAMREWMFNAAQAYNPQHQAKGPVQGIPGNATGTGGFSVSGLTPPQQQSTPADSVVAMMQGLRKLGIPDELAQVYESGLNSGHVTPEQVMGHAQQYLNEQQTREHQGETAKRVEAREAKSDQRAQFSENARRLTEAQRAISVLLNADKVLAGGLKAGNAQLMAQSPNLAKYRNLERMVQNLQTQVIGEAGQQPAAPQTTAQGGAIAWNGQRYQIGQTIKGKDGRQYKLTGKMHPDGSPEVVAQ